MKNIRIYGIALLIVLRTLFVCINVSHLSDTSLIGGDAGDYHKIAVNLSKGEGYAYGPERNAKAAALWRAPVWPGYLSIPVKLFERFGLKSVLYGNAVFYAIFLASLLYVLYKKNLVRLEGRFDWLILALILFEPHQLKYSSSMYSESFTAFLVCATGLWLFVKEGNRILDYVFAGISGLTLLCHPVMSFFVAGVVMIKFFEKKISLSHRLLIGGIFFMVVISWPLRNYLKEGSWVLTVSQGATLSKGWNKHTVDSFSNTKGDLAVEEMNLVFVKFDTLRFNSDFIYRNSVYNQAAKAYMASVPAAMLFRIAQVKLLSNFNPIPDTRKPGFIETIGTLYRIGFLLVLLAMVVSKKFRRRFPVECKLLVLMVIAQSIMSVFIYTGLRFNSPYYLLVSVIFVRILVTWLSGRTNGKIDSASS